MLLVGFRLRQQRMQEDATSRVDEERVGQLAETEVYDLTEQRVHRDVDARDALEVTEREHRQTAGRYHSCQKQEAFDEKCWAHSPQRAAARRITIHQVSLVSRRTPPA